MTQVTTAIILAKRVWANTSKANQLLQHVLNDNEIPHSVWLMPKEMWLLPKITLAEGRSCVEPLQCYYLMYHLHTTHYCST